MRMMQFQIKINAPKEKVWSTLWEDNTFRDWANIIDEGMYIKGLMNEGEIIEFISAVNGYGVTSFIEKLIPNEYVLFFHNADTKESGTQLREDEWTGGTESYCLDEKDGITTLVIKIEVPLELEEIFSDRLPRALQHIKALAEEL